MSFRPVSGLAPGARAWDEHGHRLIGSLAQQFIHNDDPRLEQRMRHLLGGVDLATAATWADCAGDVRPEGKRFVYRPTAATPLTLLEADLLLAAEQVRALRDPEAVPGPFGFRDALP